MAVPSIVWLSVTEVKRSAHSIRQLLTHPPLAPTHPPTFPTHLSRPLSPISSPLSYQLTHIPTLTPSLIPTSCLVSTHPFYPCSDPSLPISSSLSSPPAVSSLLTYIIQLAYIIPACLYHPSLPISSPFLSPPAVHTSLSHPCSHPSSPISSPFSSPPLSRLELNSDMVCE